MDAIAVVVPTHRRPSELQRALRSVATQSRRPDLLVVVDVGGTSWDERGASAFGARTGIKTTWLRCANGTFAGGARNRGAAEVARTAIEWTAFLDDDDTWDPAYLAAAGAIGQPGVDLVATRITQLLRDRQAPLPLLPVELTARHVLVRNPGITGSNIVIRSGVFQDLGGYDEELAAFNDLDFLVRLLDSGHTIRINQEPYVFQWIAPGRHSTSASTQRLTALDQYLAKYGDRMTPDQRRLLRSDRHRILKHVASSRRSRFGHLLADVAQTSPLELARRAARRARLGGGYD